MWLEKEVLPGHCLSVCGGWGGETAEEQLIAEAK